MKVIARRGKMKRAVNDGVDGEESIIDITSRLGGGRKDAPSVDALDLDWSRIGGRKDSADDALELP